MTPAFSIRNVVAGALMMTAATLVAAQQVPVYNEAAPIAANTSPRH